MYTTCPDGQLVYTPPAKAREGLLGYVLRISEANGYETPWYIFALAGITPAQMTSGSLPIDKLSKIIGRPLQELAHQAWHSYPDGNPLPPTNGGRHQMVSQLLLKHPKICPQCVAENGSVDSAWDLRIMLACPKHRIALLDHCPVCRRKLTWFRQGLDRCRCGHRITIAEQSLFPQHTIDLLQVIYDTLHGLPTNPTPPSQMPASDLQQLGINDLLKLLTKVTNTLAGKKSRGKSATYDRDTLVHLSDFFQSWPKQFHCFLYGIDSALNQATAGLARRFDSFYRSVVTAKSIPREKLVFFRTAFGQYGPSCGPTPGADPRFFLTPEKWRELREQGLSPSQIRLQTEGTGTPTNVVNRVELARRLGVRPITARRWAEQGILGLELQDTLISGQSVYKTPIKLPNKVTDGAVDIHKAAKHLGISVSMLERLRHDGYYHVDHLSARFKQFNYFDLNKLRADFLACAPKKIPDVPASFITLATFCRMRIYGPDNKYRILRNILDGTLIPVGRLGENIGDLVIDGQSIQSFREDVSIHYALPALIVGKVLECDPRICPTLVTWGELQGSYRGRNLYVTTQSLEEFRAKYLSCQSIAKRLNSTSKLVVRLLTDQGINLLNVPRPNRSNVSPQPFSPREQAEQLFGSIIVLPMNIERGHACA